MITSSSSSVRGLELQDERSLFLDSQDRSFFFSCFFLNASQNLIPSALCGTLRMVSVPTRRSPASRERVLTETRQGTRGRVGILDMKVSFLLDTSFLWYLWSSCEGPANTSAVPTPGQMLSSVVLSISVSVNLYKHSSRTALVLALCYR